MVNHTKEFLVKHQALINKRLEEKRIKQLNRENKKKETYIRILKRHKDRYANMSEEMKNKYLLIQSQYREEYSLKRECKRIENVVSVLKGKTYSIYYNNICRPYYITNEGEIFNREGKIIKPNLTTLGYLQVAINEKNKSVHRLVWEAFNGVIPEGYEIDHINGDRKDNRLCNLRLVTHKQNCNNPIAIERYKAHNKTVDRSYLKKNF